MECAGPYFPLLLMLFTPSNDGCTFLFTLGHDWETVLILPYCLDHIGKTFDFYLAMKVGTFSGCEGAALVALQKRWWKCEAHQWYHSGERLGFYNCCYFLFSWDRISCDSCWPWIPDASATSLVAGITDMLYCTPLDSVTLKNNWKWLIKEQDWFLLLKIGTRL